MYFTIKNRNSEKCSVSIPVVAMLILVLIYAGLSGYLHWREYKVAKAEKAIATIVDADGGYISFPERDKDYVLLANSTLYTNYKLGGCTYAIQLPSEETGQVGSVSYDYDSYTASQIAYCQFLLNDLTAEIRAKMWDGIGTRDTVKLIHDTIIEKYEYDYTHTVYTAFEMMLYGKGVCAAYARLFWLVCEEFGIECRYVRSDEINHAWNVVRINGWYFHIDCTWDDGGGDTVEYDYFLLPFLQMNASHPGMIDEYGINNFLLQNVHFALGIAMIPTILIYVWIVISKVSRAKKYGGDPDAPVGGGRASKKEYAAAIEKAKELHYLTEDELAEAEKVLNGGRHAHKPEPSPSEEPGDGSIHDDRLDDN